MKDETIRIRIPKAFVMGDDDGRFVNIDTGMKADELILYALGMDPTIDTNIVVPLTTRIQELRTEKEDINEFAMNMRESYDRLNKEFVESHRELYDLKMSNTKRKLFR